MTMVASGTISLGALRTEMGASGAFSLHNAEVSLMNNCSASKPDGSNPNSLSEWYSYNHSTASYSGRNCYSEICSGTVCSVNNGSLLFCEGMPVGLNSDGIGNPYRSSGSTFTSCSAPDATGAWTSVASNYCCL